MGELKMTVTEKGPRFQIGGPFLKGRTIPHTSMAPTSAPHPINAAVETHSTQSPDMPWGLEEKLSPALTEAKTWRILLPFRR